MTAKPTAIVVRLPLSGEDCMTIRKHITSKCLTNDGIVNGIRAIGTPVAGGDLEVVGYVPGEDIPLYGDEGIDDTCFTEMSLHRQADNDIPLVRQSDAQSALAAAQAENVRLREALVKSHAALERVTDERSTSYQARNGKWVSIQGDDGERCDIIHSDVTTDCEAAIKDAETVLKDGNL